MRPASRLDQRLHEPRVSDIVRRSHTAAIAASPRNAMALALGFAFAQANARERRVGDLQYGHPITLGAIPARSYWRDERNRRRDVVNCGLPAARQSPTSGRARLSRH